MDCQFIVSLDNANCPRRFQGISNSSLQKTRLKQKAKGPARLTLLVCNRYGALLIDVVTLLINKKRFKN